MEFLKVLANNKEIVENILSIERDVFGDGAIDEWNLKPYIKYGKVFVLKEKETIYGIVELLKIWGKEEVYIYGFSTNPKYCGKGYGKLLLEKTLKFLEEEKIEKVCLTVSPENKIAINLYKKYGFEIKENLYNEYGKGIDRISMEKIID